MSDYNDFLKRLTVIVNGGSGLLFKPSIDSRNAFLFTAHHVLSESPNFKENTFPTGWNIKAFQPEESQISLSSSTAQYIYISDKTKHDLVVVNISDSTSLNFDPPVLDIFDGEFDASFVVGYPNIKTLANNKFKKFKCGERSDTDKRKYMYQVNTQEHLQTEDSNDVESVKGTSGGGVIILGGDGHCHLAGIVRSSELFGDFAFTSVYDLMDEINNNLDPTDTKLKAYAQQCYYECGIDPAQLKIDEIKKAIIETQNNKLLENYDVNDPLASLKSKQGDANSAYLKITQKQKELSNYYVLLGIIHEEHNQPHSSTACFKKAIQLDSKNEYIYNEAYMKRGTRKNPNKSLYEKNKKAYKTKTVNLLSDSEDLPDSRRLISLNEIIHYHYTSYKQNQLVYIQDLADEDKHELRSFCEDYIKQSCLEHPLEARLLLIETYISLDRMTHAEVKCETFLTEKFILKPTKEQQFILLELRYLLAIKIRGQATNSDWQEFRQFASEPVDGQLAVCFVSHALEVVESLYQSENDKGLVGIERLERLYSPLRSALHSDNPMLDDIAKNVQSSYDEKMAALINGGANRSKEDLAKENKDLRQFNSFYEEKINTLKLRIENLENPKPKITDRITKEQPKPLWEVLLRPFIFLRSTFK